MSADEDDVYGSYPPDPPPRLCAPAHVHRLYYDAGGNIVGYQFSNAPLVRDDADHIDFDVLDHDVSPATHKIDRRTKRPVRLSDAELAAKNAVQLHEVKAAIITELAWTDQFMHAPPDRPLSWDADAYAQYRQTLRDLSKRFPEHAAAQVRAWPPRPDGADPVQHLKARLPG